MPSTSAESDRHVFAALYYDGRTAQRHSVSVHLHPSALDVVGEGGTVLDQWLYGEVELSDQGNAGARVVKRGSEARLVIADRAAFIQLKALSPHLEDQRQRTLRNMGLSVAVTAAIILLGYFSLPLLADGIVRLIPVETEVRIGAAYVDEVAVFFAPDKQGALCKDIPGKRVLDGMVAHLAQFAGGPFPYRVDILDTPLVNAVALPGGRILLFKGVLNKAESFDEVAGVIAHEMQHVNERHGMQTMVRSYGVRMLADMMFGGSMMGNVSQLMMAVSYSRDDEVAADEGAIATLRAAGIGAAGMARFFARLNSDEKSGTFALPDLLSTHPPSATREALARDADQSTNSARHWSLSTADWAALKAICQ